jgi:hypothetical protein
MIEKPRSQTTEIHIILTKTKDPEALFKNNLMSSASVEVSIGKCRAQSSRIINCCSKVKKEAMDLDQCSCDYQHHRM